MNSQQNPRAARSDFDSFGPAEWAVFVAISLIWGASFLLIKISLLAFHPGLVTWGRLSLGALTLALFPASRSPIEPGDRGAVAALSLVWVAVPFTLFPLAEQHINSAVTGLLNGATPFFVSLVGALFYRRATRGAQRLGIAAGFCGVALVSAGTSAEGGTAFAGVAMVLAATLCYGFATNMAGPLQKKYGSLPLMSRMLAMSAAWTAPFGIYGAFHSGFGWGPFAALAALGVLGAGAAFAMMASLVGRVGAPRASLITYLIPVVSLGLGAVFLGEKVTATALAGAALIVAAALIGSRAEQK